MFSSVRLRAVEFILVEAWRRGHKGSAVKFSLVREEGSLRPFTLVA